MSNPRIGDRLYISRRTVQTHLAHVFAKLDITSRAQLAALVAQHRGGQPADGASSPGARSRRSPHPAETRPRDHEAAFSATGGLGSRRAV